MPRRSRCTDELPNYIHGNSSSSFISDLTFDNVTIGDVAVSLISTDPAVFDANQYV